MSFLEIGLGRRRDPMMRARGIGIYEIEKVGGKPENKKYFFRVDKSDSELFVLT